MDNRSPEVTFSPDSAVSQLLKVNMYPDYTIMDVAIARDVREDRTNLPALQRFFLDRSGTYDFTHGGDSKSAWIYRLGGTKAVEQTLDMLPLEHPARDDLIEVLRRMAPGTEWMRKLAEREMDTLPKYLTNIDSLKVSEIRKLAKKILKENRNEMELLQFAKELLEFHSKNKTRVGINLLISLSITPEKLIKEEIKNLAENEDWELREEAAQVIRGLLEKDFDKWFLLLKEFINSQSINLKRAAVVGSMATGIKSESQIRRIANEIYQPVLNDSENYIRVNLGPFAFGAFFLRLFPDIAFKYFDKWIRRENDWTRWNVLMAFSASRGKEYPDKARKYIEIVKDDQSFIVQRAIKSVSKNTKTPTANRY